jgi:hypothetical protein
VTTITIGSFRREKDDQPCKKKQVLYVLESSISKRPQTWKPQMEPDLHVGLVAFKKKIKLTYGRVFFALRCICTYYLKCIFDTFENVKKN